MKKMMMIMAGIGISVSCFSAPGAASKDASSKADRRAKREIRKDNMRHAVTAQMNYRLFTDYPNATDVSWTVDAYEKASFTDQGVQKIAYYDMNNEWVGTATESTLDNLPAHAKGRISSRFPGYSVNEVILFEDNADNSDDLVLYPGLPASHDNYYVELQKDSRKIVLQVTKEGDLSFFRREK